MIFDLNFIPDENYYKEAYTEITSSLKLKKYEPCFAVAMVFLGVIFYFLDTYRKLGLFPFFFSGVGMYEFYKIYHRKNKWLNERSDSRNNGKQLQLKFTEHSIKHNGPFSNGEIRWDGLKDILKTKRGLLLKPENGISIYLPYRLFENEEQIEFVFSKKKKAI